MYDVITVGSATIDCFVDTGESLFQQITKHKDESIVVIPFGTKIVIDKLIFLTGGGGTNSAVSFARLGLKTAYLGKIGGGQASQVTDELTREGVDTSLIVPGDDVGFSVILDSKGHDRTILTHKGCNNDMVLDEIDLSKIQAKWLYCSSMMGKAHETLIKLIKYAQKKGIKVAFNPSSYMAKFGFKKLQPILQYVDALIFNKEEAAELLGEQLEITDTLKRLKKLIDGNKAIVVVTDGKNGAHCYADKYYYIGSHPVAAKEATGAGDAFASGFVGGIVLGFNIPKCLQMGLANAESVIQHIGAKNKLLTLPEMEKAIKKDPGIVTSRKI